MKLVDVRNYPANPAPEALDAIAELSQRQARLRLAREKEYLEALGLNIVSLKPHHIEAFELLESLVMLYHTCDDDHHIFVCNDGRYGTHWDSKTQTCYFSLNFFPEILARPAVTLRWEETTYDSLHIRSATEGWVAYIGHH